MKYYTRNRFGSARTNQILFRILFVILVAAVITFGTIFLGNYLNQKLDRLVPESPESEPTDTGVLQKENETDISASHRHPSVRGVGLNPHAFSSEDELLLKINALSLSYDTLTMPLTDSDGNLLYSSAALRKQLRLPDDGMEHRMLEDALTGAKANGMRLTALLRPLLVSYSGSYLEEATLDAVLFDELASFGFDEVLLIPSAVFTSVGEDDATEYFCRYLAACRDAMRSDCTIGVILPQSLYSDSDAAKQIQLYEQNADFLAIEFSISQRDTLAKQYRNVLRSIRNLLGSFSVYDMRVVITETDANSAAAVYEACLASEITNLTFTSAFLPEELIYRVDEDETETPPESMEEETPSGASNPYATVETKEEEPAATPKETDADAPYVGNESDRPWY